MKMERKLIVNSVLCFISSAYKDYNVDALKELVYSFYTFDDIIEAKQIIYDILNNEIVSRREPNKKKKEIDDIFEKFESLNDVDIVFVCDDYKRLPPSGLDNLASVLTSISENVLGLTGSVPHITSQVDTLCNEMEQIKIPVSNLKRIEDILSNDVLHLKMMFCY